MRLFGKAAKSDDKGRLSYGRRGAVFMVTSPIDGAAGDARQWLDHRLQLRQPRRSRRLARGRCRGRRHRDRGSARLSRRSVRQALPRLSARSRRQQIVRAAPRARHEHRNRPPKQVRTAGGSWSSNPRLGGDRHRHDLLGFPAAAGGRQGELPVLWYLSGLTCTHANVTEKGEFRAACAEHGIIFVAPDTSPRGEEVPDDPEGTVGLWPGRRLLCRCHRAALGPALQHVDLSRRRAAGVGRRPSFPVDMGRQGITGHSMGGHGALTAGARLSRPVPQRLGIRADRRPEPGAVGPEGAKPLPRRGSRPGAAHDAVALIEDGARMPELLVDVGDADPFLEKELQAGAAGTRLRRRRHRR